MHGMFLAFCAILFVLAICTLLYFVWQKHLKLKIKKDEIELKKVKKDTKNLDFENRQDTDSTSDTQKYEISLSSIPELGVLQDKPGLIALPNVSSSIEDYGEDAVEVLVIE